METLQPVGEFWDSLDPETEARLRQWARDCRRREMLEKIAWALVGATFAIASDGVLHWIWGAI